MGRKLSLFNRRPRVELEPEFQDALRDIAGWPLQQHQEGGYRLRHREVTIQRDANGQPIGSVEHAFEDIYEEHQDNWGK